MRLVLLTLLLLPSIAHASVGVAGVTIAGFLLSWYAVAQIVLIVASYFYGAAQKRKAARQARDSYNSALQDRTVSGVATESPYTYIYGEARVGGSIVAILSSGAKDEFKHIVTVHAAHECDSFQEIYIQGKALGTLDGSGFVTAGDYYSTRTEIGSEVTMTNTVTMSHTPDSGTVSAYTDNGEGGSNPVTIISIVGLVVTVDNPFSVLVSVTYRYKVPVPRVRVQKHLGTPTDTVDAFLNGLLPAQWPSTSVLRGFCYTVVTIDLNQPEFQTGIPHIEARIRGRKLLDPRTGLTAWSSNPALVAYDYLRSEICGVPSADIPTAELITAANVCDEVVVGNPAGGVRYTFNGSLTSDQAQSPTLEKMEEAMVGIIVPTTWEISAGKYVAPVMALYQEDIVGAHGTTPGAADADIYNGIRGQYISPENSYVATDFAPYQNSAYVTADGGRELWHANDFPFTDSLQRVWNLCRIMVEDQRNGFTITALFSQKAWGLRVGQRVTFTSAFYGQAAKIYRVMDKKFSPNAMVDLVLKADDPTIWDFANATTAAATPNSNLPNPFAIAPLASITCASGDAQLLRAGSGDLISRILVTWPQATTQAVFTQGLIEIEWQKIGSTVIDKAQVSGSDTQAYLSPVLDRAVYNVRARTVNTYLNVKSDWTYPIEGPHKVIGKTERPPNVTAFSIAGAILNWTPVVASDLNGYVFRFHYGNNTDWGTAVDLHKGVITESPFDLVVRPSGPVTIMVKAVDTSGNESLATANIFTDLGDAPIANIVETITFDPTFPGTYSGCSVVGGVLVAAALDSFYGTGTQSFYGLGTQPFYKVGAFGKMIYTTSPILIASGLSGSKLTLLSTNQGADLFIEYRKTAPSPFFGNDSDPFFDADAAPFFDDTPSGWAPWPGQIVVDHDVYEFRFTIGAGTTQGKLFTFSLVIDAPTIVEYVNDLAVANTGTAIPYTSAFTVIKNVQATLQANGSGAVTVEIDKTDPLHPVAKAYNPAHTAVGGAAIDATIKGY